ncbi:MAG: hypothetical protein IPG96_00135 [Proteobacteria bacterium]|nr:hypothetical protein [Pseudomonadota bacterium]
MARAGYLEQVAPATSVGPAPRVAFTVHSLPLAWNDLNSNFLFDAPAEQLKLFELAAAVAIKPTKPSSAPAGSAGETRMVVVADSDLASDGLLFSRAVGNRYLLLDAFKWLGANDQPIGETASEDVPISACTCPARPALVLSDDLWHAPRAGLGSRPDLHATAQENGMNRSVAAHATRARALALVATTWSGRASRAPTTTRSPSSACRRWRARPTALPSARSG